MRRRLAFALCLAACSGGSAHRDGGVRPDGAVAPDGGTTVDAGADAGSGPTATVHYVGRFDFSDPAGAKFAWPGSKIFGRFSGTGISVALDDQGTNFWSVYVDGNPATMLATSGSATYPLASGLPAGTHDVALVKRTESFVGTVQFLGFTVDGGAMVPTPDPTTRRIEIIGDSISCGYGDLGADMNCSFSADTENEDAAYGAITARTLGAAHMSIAYSGIGVTHNYGTSSPDNTMPMVYGRTFADDPTSTWAFSTPAPDVVVINLGTNDFSTGDPGTAFVDAYASFIAAVRTHAPSAHVLLAVSPMLGEPDHTTEKGYLQSVITKRAAAGDTRITLVDFATQDCTTDGCGCDWHPSLATHQKMADVLVPAIKAVTGW